MTTGIDKALIAELRELAARPYNSWHQPAITQAADEIERLTRAHDARSREGDAMENRIGTLEQEIERLTRERDQLIAMKEIVQEQARRIERLRAALQNIADGGGFYPTSVEAGELCALAREALRGAGAPNPTHGPGPCPESRCILMRGHDGPHDYQ